eukprot:SAG31_NODE_692_length_12772_cov_15.543044_13_plen_84_part_00
MVAPTELGDTPRGPDRTGSFRRGPRQNWEQISRAPTYLDFIVLVTRQNRAVPDRTGSKTAATRHFRIYPFYLFNTEGSFVLIR